VSEYSEGTRLQIKPPHKGEWHVIVDLKGQGDEVRAVVEVVDGPENQ